jgi:hypothetical protein
VIIIGKSAKFMQPNFWIYRSKAEQNKIAGSLVAFGAEVAAKANVFQGIHALRECNKLLQQNKQYNTAAVAQHFGLDYLMDSVRILIFFENYMKAELIVRNFCVHNIDKSNVVRTDLIALAKQQDKRPVTLSEVREVEKFVVNDEKEIINNAGLRETTIGMNVLLKPSYLEHYAFDDEILRTVKGLNLLRNKLHFHSHAEFALSSQFIEDIERLHFFIHAMVHSLVASKPTGPMP